MKNLITGKSYVYQDAKTGTKYLSHTCTDADEEMRPTGEDLMYTVQEGGDHTVTNSNKFTQRTLGIGAMGATRGV